MENIIFYTTHCPKCNILKLKLNQKNISYMECDDMDTMLQLGIKSAPALKVNNEILDFGAAVKWVNQK
jgi:hypothetical protein